VAAGTGEAPSRPKRAGVRPGDASGLAEAADDLLEDVGDHLVAEHSFGSVRVDGVTYDHDLIIDRGKIRRRSKAASKKVP